MSHPRLILLTINHQDNGKVCDPIELAGGLCLPLFGFIVHIDFLLFGEAIATAKGESTRTPFREAAVFL